MATSPRPAVTIEQIQVAVTAAVTTAIAKQDAAKHEQLIILTENVKTISQTVMELDHTVNGNGKEGLDKRVDRLEQARVNSPWRSIGLRIMELVIMGVIVAILVLIQEHGIPIK